MEILARTPRQIGSGLKQFRKSAKLSQADLGHQADLWQETISNIERGSPGTRIETLCHLLNVLNLELVIRPRTSFTPEDIAELF